MKHMNIIQFNNWAKSNIIDEKKFNDNCFIIMENDNNYKSTGFISQIDAYKNIKITLIEIDIILIKKSINIDFHYHNLGVSVLICPINFLDDLLIIQKKRLT